MENKARGVGLDLLDGVQGVVEATSFEKYALWQLNKFRDNPRTWIENLQGQLAIVGYVGNDPVCISLLVDKVSNQKILFWHATSKIVDYDQIKKWLETYLPLSSFKNGILNNTDANNFNNVFR